MVFLRSPQGAPGENFRESQWFSSGSPQGGLGENLRNPMVSHTPPRERAAKKTRNPMVLLEIGPGGPLRKPKKIELFSEGYTGSPQVALVKL